MRIKTGITSSFLKFADFIPVLPMESNVKVGVIDCVIKVVGGAVTFALIAVALRRRFERRFRH